MGNDLSKINFDTGKTRPPVWQRKNLIPKELPKSETDTWRKNLPCILVNPQERFRQNLTRAILQTIESGGYHQDTLERIEIAIVTDMGKEALAKLTLSQAKDVEVLVQMFLEIYSAHISQ